MAHLTIYLPDDLEDKVRKAAKAEGSNISRWVADKVSKAVDASWPPEFLELAGAFPDFPTVEELRKGYGPDAPREELD